MNDFSFSVPDDLHSLSAPSHAEYTEPAAPAVPHTPVSTMLPDVAPGTVINTHTWADDWFFEHISGFCGLSAAAFIVNQFVGAGVFDADSIAMHACDRGLPHELANASSIAEIAQLITANGINTLVTEGRLEDLVACLDSGVGVLLAVETGRTILDGSADLGMTVGSDALMILTQLDVNKGVATLTNPSNWAGKGIEVPLALLEDSWKLSDWQMLQTTSINSVLNPADIVPTLDGSIARIALVNLTRRARIH